MRIKHDVGIHTEYYEIFCDLCGSSFKKIVYKIGKRHVCPKCFKDKIGPVKKIFQKENVNSVIRILI